MSGLDWTDSTLWALACTMKYFLHVEDGAGIRDAKGTDFPDDAAAMLEAAKVADELSKLQLHPGDWHVVVKNAEGLRIGSVPLTPRLAAPAEGFPIPPKLLN